MPRPVNVPLIDSKSANQLVSVAMSLPYKGKYVTKKIVEKNESGSETYDVEEFQPVEQHEPELAGMSQIEVAMIRLARLASGGNPAALEQILDRILGKPITKGMSMSTDLPYEKYLEMVANQVLTAYENPTKSKEIS
jgi:hypothetical protein